MKACLALLACGSIAILGLGGAIANPVPDTSNTAPANSSPVNAVDTIAPESGQASAGQATTGAGASDPVIPPRTIITMQNWQQYQQFMPDGMVVLFQGKSSWKMPDEVQMEVGPTVIHRLPEGYLAATAKYSPGVKIVELPDGGLNLNGYEGGIP